MLKSVTAVTLGRMSSLEHDVRHSTAANVRMEGAIALKMLNMLRV